MVIAGKARMIRKLTIRVIHVKTGSLIMVIPGARMLIMVVMKLKDASNDATPRICRAKIQKSGPISPITSAKRVSVRGAYPNHPIAGDPPVKNQLRLRISPPAIKHQRLNVFMRGKATSRAPICKGMIKLKKAALKGMITKKTIVVPCIVNIWLYSRLVRTVML